MIISTSFTDIKLCVNCIITSIIDCPLSVENVGFTFPLLSLVYI